MSRKSAFSAGSRVRAREKCANALPYCPSSNIESPRFLWMLAIDFAFACGIIAGAEQKKRHKYLFRLTTNES